MSNTTGAENIRWDFADLYESENDPKIEEDFQSFLSALKKFATVYKGSLNTKLGEALEQKCILTQKFYETMVYLYLRTRVENENQALKKVDSRVNEISATAWATYSTFWDHEIAEIPEETYQKLLNENKSVAHHKPYLDQIRKQAKYLLDENVEEALAKRSPFGAQEWDDFVDEQLTKATFVFEDNDLGFEEIVNIIGNDVSDERRALAMKVLNEGLKEKQLDAFFARALNVTMGEKAVSDNDRGYKHPMHARNIENMVDDETVEALHKAVEEVAAPLAMRFYKLKAKWLGKDVLKWSDRNAPLPVNDSSIVMWDEGFAMVKDAFGSFSPTLRKLVEEMVENKCIDAPVYKGKTSGAFCCGVAAPGNNGEAKPMVYVMLNHLGKRRDFMTVAHELGHAVHYTLSVKSQNALMYDSPLAYAETASIFAEMVTFEHMMKKCDDDKERLALYVSKMDDFINSVVRQISFSYFEQQAHAKRAQGKLTTEDFCNVWLDVSKRFYGEDGDVFSFKNMENMWCYVGHFMRPFYVYAYAFGELFTQSLYAVKDQFGDDFEPMYLDMLRSGGTKDAVALMKPFGLDPKNPEFWKKGIEESLGKWLDEAECISEALKYKA